MRPIRLFHKASQICALGVLVASGCGDDHGDHVHPDAGWDCSQETRADVFVAGLTKTSEMGVEVQLLESTPAPPAKGDNNWVLQVFDADASPVDDLTLSVVPFMPDHGHGTGVVPTVSATGVDGKYTVERVNLWMPGLWEVTVKLDEAGSDKVVYSFCIDG